MYLWRGSGYQSDAGPLAKRYFQELVAGDLSALFIWGHSWDLDTGNAVGNDWVSFERFLSEVSTHHEIWSTTLIDMAQYLLAIENATIKPIDATHIEIVNRSERSLWLKTAPDLHAKGKARAVKPHESVVLLKAH